MLERARFNIFRSALARAFRKIPPRIGVLITSNPTPSPFARNRGMSPLMLGVELLHVLEGQGLVVELELIDEAVVRGIPEIHSQRELRRRRGCEHIREAGQGVRESAVEVDV